MPTQVIRPNSAEKANNKNLSIFLAGSIEMGSAEDWQKVLISEILQMNKNITIYNPRRDDWDSSWIQEQANPQFNHQVNWELNSLEVSDIIFMYFSPETKSPISLLELGLNAASSKMVVCCPDGFWRKGNVDIVCSRMGIPLFTDMKSAIGALKTKINQYARN
jgi:hypothetical protein